MAAEGRDKPSQKAADDKRRQGAADAAADAPVQAKGGKGGKGKKKTESLLIKEWFDVTVPHHYKTRIAAKTLANKTKGLKRVEDNLKGRILELNLADLTESDQHGYRKLFFRIDDVIGRQALMNYHGASLTTDKLRSILKKRTTLIEAEQSIRTSDGHVIRIFVIGRTKRTQQQVKKNAKAQPGQVQRIRKRICNTLHTVCAKLSLREVFQKIEDIPKDIEKACNPIYPMQDILIRRLKLLKAPKLDPQRFLQEVHGGSLPTSREDLGIPAAGVAVAAVVAPAAEEASA